MIMAIDTITHNSYKNLTIAQNAQILWKIDIQYNI